MTVKMYLVGGYVRDEILGVKSKDIDYSVEAPSYEAMREEILRRGGEIFLEKPEYLTIRARVPELGAADFVLCRKDGSYYDGRRPESVEPGTLLDDLARRDFTMNAIALTEDGEYVDPHGGRADLQAKVIRCVGEARERFDEDYLRMLRALRFSITKDMRLDRNIVRSLQDPVAAGNLRDVSIERVREELLKMFHHDTTKTLFVLEDFQYVKNAILCDTGLWLKPTLEQ